MLYYIILHERNNFWQKLKHAQEVKHFKIFKIIRVAKRLFV